MAINKALIDNLMHHDVGKLSALIAFRILEMGSIMGSGSMIIIDEETCIVDLARFFLTFTQRESCGKCTPCRIGTRQMLGILERITKGEAVPSDLDKLSSAVKNSSLCGLDSTAPISVLIALKNFRNEFEEHILGEKCPSLVCRELTSFFVNPKRCRGSGVCADSCPSKAILGQPKAEHVIDQAKCIRCGACFSVCPDKFNAITCLPGRKVVQCG